MPANPLLRPKYWAAHLIALVLVGIAVGLGFWQLDAWQQRREAEARDLSRIDPIPLADAIGPDDPFPGDQVGAPVIVDGTWIDDATFFVSDREHDGRNGYWVVTPLSVGGADAPALLVVRGWTASPDDAPSAPTGDAELVAWLQPAEGTGAVDDDPADDVLPQVRVADALQRVDVDLYGAYAVVAADADDVAAGDWPVGEAATNDGTVGLEQADLDQRPSVGRFTAVRNLLYAVEWWIFGLFAGFIWWQWARDERRRLEDLPSSSDAQVEDVNSSS